MPFLMLLMTVFTLQSGTQGRWELHRKVPPPQAEGLTALTPERIQFSLRPDDDSHMDNTYAASEIATRFRGLAPEQLDAFTRTAAHFEVRQDAGTFVCDGYVENGRGAGTYVFHPDPNFKSQMQSLGYSNISDRQVAALALLGFTSQYVRDIRAAGVAAPPLDELIGMWAVGVTMDYLRDMQRIGLMPTANDLIGMHVQNVTPEFVRDVRQIYPHASINDLIGMQVQGVTIDFVKQARQSDPGVSINDLIAIRVLGSKRSR
jgi:hypothetical protein